MMMIGGVNIVAVVVVMPKVKGDITKSFDDR